MPTQIHDLEHEPIGGKLQLLNVGAEKSGKTELAVTAPDPVLVLDFDLRADSLAGRKGIYAVTFRDPTDTLTQPTAFNELLDFIGKMEKSLLLRDLGFLSAPEGLAVKTVVPDSISTIANAARRYVLYSNPKELAYVINTGKHQFRSPRNWHGWTTEMEMVESAILRLLGLPINVVANLHETKEEAEDSTEEQPKYTGQIAVFPVRYRILLKYFNEVWRLTRDKEGPPMIQCNPNGVFTKASSALRLSSIPTANIKQVLDQQRQKQPK